MSTYEHLGLELFQIISPLIIRRVSDSILTTTKVVPFQLDLIGILEKYFENFRPNTKVKL